SALSGVSIGGVADSVIDLFGRSFLLELVSKDFNWKTVKAYAKYVRLDFDPSVYTYKCKFDVPNDFGEIGAVLIENEYHTKMFFKSVVLDDGAVTFTCDAWVPSKHDNPEKRIFFANKSYLPSQTPDGLKALRARDLEFCRGTGKGERKSFQRIYDYDIYNDLGDPDEDITLARPPLGGDDYPYPRRCRTGRPMSISRRTYIVPYYLLKSD
nr:linoleate 13S-lipoxygenase 2-1, chloroplastic-like [Tanacetum cinerariifolium]